MSYRVDYTDNLSPPPEKDGGKMLQKLGVLLLAGLLLVGLLWPEGRAALREALVPGNASVTTAALEELTEQLRSGAGLLDSLEQFCRQVWEGASLGAP